jgi:protein arginine kinase activator
MASNLKCQVCSKPATVHFTQIVNNKVHKIDLCEACAQAKGITDPSGFSLADLLVKAALNTEPSAATGVRCEKCGFTQGDFKKHGRFGCPHCYETFKDMVEPMLEGMHKGTKHIGKVPHGVVDRQSLGERLSKLEQELAEAIKTERYESAAQFRDEILQVKQAIASQQQQQSQDTHR